MGAGEFLFSFHFFQLTGNNFVSSSYDGTVRLWSDAMTRHSFVCLHQVMTFLIARFVRNHTKCVTDLDLQLKMIVFESILTTFEVSVIF